MAENLFLFDPNRNQLTSPKRPAARRSDPATSHSAARDGEASGKFNSHRALALRMVRRYPGSTATELEFIAGVFPGTIRKRLVELETDELIEKGITRPCGQTKRPVQTWRPVY